MILTIQFTIGSAEMNKHVIVTELTPEIKSIITDQFASRFIGRACRHCGKVYETIKDVNAADIWDGQQPMHEECFKVWIQKAGK